ncbi:hypothetical protein PDIP_84830 [Penicillium digitatum Pd1]|uniref:Uncharacterized protein n=1 Tax=Penicillium digitatum (strain Pd1 / CECT 20795) TaxID=1170230 RepID=K9FVL4_PEND1|nr:hypothetical protein PDIP_84830 [Penicillium digitatum Pd1]EKV05121.1 hypothetical protein PDIP_84830 [Penicillium digitatum Pd1]
MADTETDNEGDTNPHPLDAPTHWNPRSRPLPIRSNSHRMTVIVKMRTTNRPIRDMVFQRLQ